VIAGLAVAGRRPLEAAVSYAYFRPGMAACLRLQRVGRGLILPYPVPMRKKRAERVA
jgi:hypothetical protein